MGRKVLICFLGTNNYIPCNYYLEDETSKQTDNVRFVQEAVIEQYCNNFNKNDQIHLFITKDAKERNWEDNGHKNWSTGEMIPSEGLKSRLEKINTKAQICQHQISDGVDRKEIWEIFTKVAEQINENDHVYFDITHGFRSLPMLGIVLINYAKALHNITVGGIYYGAFEYLGTAAEAKKMPLEKRDAPILNLSQFAELQEWALAASVFSKYGITKLIAEQTRQQKAYFSKEGEEDLLDSFAAHMDNLFLNFSTVRGEAILKGNHLRLSKSIQKISQSKTVKQDIPPLEGILEKVDVELQQMTGTSKDGLDHGMKAVEWMYKNGLIQQGVTLIRELIIFYAIKYCDFDWQTNRRRVHTQFFSHCLSSDTPMDEWVYECDIENAVKKVRPRFKDQEREKIEDFLDAIEDRLDGMEDFRELFRGIKPYRDNMNHGDLGMSGKKRKESHEFSGVLEQAINGMNTLIKKYNLNAN